ncbi:MAG: hypothetical protein P4N59_01710 [Negativicutes bacterium]|nr:hypothetical protein [Negativicutes bacterium]
MHRNLLELAAQIGDLKDVDYKNTLAIAALIELLINKGLFTREEFTAQAVKLDRASLAEILLSRRAHLAGK